MEEGGRRTPALGVRKLLHVELDGDAVTEFLGDRIGDERMERIANAVAMERRRTEHHHPFGCGRADGQRRDPRFVRELGQLGFQAAHDSCPDLGGEGHDILFRDERVP
jgi:hypothetical protein